MAQNGPIILTVSQSKKVYFASDQHFGAPSVEDSKIRETHFIHWLQSIQPDCSALFLLGDLFDFWFEYTHVVPKGFIRVLGKLAEFSDAGIPVFFFTGNHDLWMKDYFEKELHFQIFKNKQEFIINQKLFLVAHGDGLGPADKGYKRLKKVFNNTFFQWLYRWLHPDLGIPLGNYMSQKNKIISGEEDKKFLGNEKEWLVQYAEKKTEEKDYDFFVFGHRHLPLCIKLSNGATYVNLGDWIQYNSYAQFNGETMELLSYEKS